VQTVPRLCELYPAIYLTTYEKAGENLNQGRKNLSLGRKNLGQGRKPSIRVGKTSVSAEKP
jgi:hypothetical protein